MPDGWFKAEIFRFLDFAVYVAGFAMVIFYAYPRWGAIGGALAFLAYCVVSIFALGFLKAYLKLPRSDSDRPRNSIPSE